MKLIVKLCLVLLLLVVSMSIWQRQQAGEPLLSVNDWRQMPFGAGELLQDVGELVSELVPAGAAVLSESSQEAQPEAPISFYRWQDAEGVWHFADKPPADLADAEQLEFSRVSNSLGVIETQAPVTEVAPATGTAPPMNSSISPRMPEGVSKEAIEEMLQDTHERRLGDHL